MYVLFGYRLILDTRDTWIQIFFLIFYYLKKKIHVWALTRSLIAVTASVQLFGVGDSATVLRNDFVYKIQIHYFWYTVVPRTRTPLSRIFDKRGKIPTARESCKSFLPRLAGTSVSRTNSLRPRCPPSRGTTALSS